MKNESTAMKIDLEAVKELATALPQLNSKEYDGVCLSYADCELIADALEQLPKLVRAVSKMEDVMEFVSATKSDHSFRQSDFLAVKQALEPFTNQPQP